VFRRFRATPSASNVEWIGNDPINDGINGSGKAIAEAGAA